MDTIWAAIISGVFTLASAFLTAYLATHWPGNKSNETPAKTDETPANTSEPSKLWVPRGSRPATPVQEGPIGRPINVPGIYRRGTFLHLIVTILGGIAGWTLITGIFYYADPSHYDVIHEAMSILLPIILYVIAARFISLHILLSTKYIILWLIVAVATVPVAVYVSSLFPSEPVVLAVVSLISNFLSAFWIYGIIGRMMIRFSNRKRNVLVSTGF